MKSRIFRKIGEFEDEYLARASAKSAVNLTAHDSTKVRLHP